MPTDPSTSGREAGRCALLLAAPLAIAVAVYARALDGPLVFDDLMFHRREPRHKAARQLPHGDLRRWGAPRQPRATNLTFALNYAAGGLEPWNSHLTPNLIIHLAVVVLVYAFTLRVVRLAGAERPAGTALAVAGVFAVHPFQPRPSPTRPARGVPRVRPLPRGEILLLEAGRREGTWRGVVAWAGALLAFAAGLAAKTIVVTAPVAYLLVGAVLGGPPAARAELGTWRRRVVRAAPLLALGAAHAVRVLRFAPGQTDAGFSVPGLTPTDYLATQLSVILTYLRLLFWPSGQNIVWDYPIAQGLTDPRALRSALALVAIAGGAIVAAVRYRTASGPSGPAARLAALGVGWFAVLLAPTSSFVPIADVLVEHRLYLASWGVFVAVAAGAERATAPLGRRGRLGLTVAVGVAWIGLAAVTYQRNAVWESSEALWRDAVAKSPGKPRIAMSLGQTLRVQGRYEEAMGVYVTALKRARGDRKAEAWLLNGLGMTQWDAGQFADAMATYQRAVERAPTEPSALHNLANGYLFNGDPAAAGDVVRRLLAVDPDDVYALSVLARAELAEGRADGSRALLDRAIGLDPDKGYLRFHRGKANLALGRIDDACRDWRGAVVAARPLSTKTLAGCLQLLRQHCGGE